MKSGLQPYLKGSERKNENTPHRPTVRALRSKNEKQLAIVSFSHNLAKSAIDESLQPRFSLEKLKGLENEKRANRNQFG